MVITLYSREGCCLCERAHEVIEPLAAEVDATIEVVDIDANETLRERFGHVIPVVEVGADIVATLRVDPAALRDYLLTRFAEEKTVEVNT